MDFLCTRDDLRKRETERKSDEYIPAAALRVLKMPYMKVIQNER